MGKKSSSSSSKIKDKTLQPEKQQQQQESYSPQTPYADDGGIGSGGGYQTAGLLPSAYQQVPDKAMGDAIRGGAGGGGRGGGGAGGGGLQGTTVFLGHEQRMMDTVSLGRGVKLFACVSGAFLLLNTLLLQGYLILLVWGPVAGFLAGRGYDRKWAMVYRIFYYLRLLGDAFMVLCGAWWFLVTLVVDIVILRYIVTFTELLETCSDEELQQLRRPESVWGATSRPFFAVF